MGYSEIKREIKEILESIDICSDEISEVEKSIESCDKNIRFSISDREKRLVDERERRFREYNDEISEPYLLNIKKLEDTKIRSKLKRDELLSKIDEGTYRAKFKTRIDVDKELESCKEIKEKTSNFYGPIFTEIVESIVQESESIESTASIIPNLRQSSSALSKSFDLQGLLDGLLNGINYKQEDNTQLPVAIAICVMIVVGYFFVYPLILILLVVIIIYNIYKSHLFVKCTSSRKSLERNAEEVRELVNSRIKNAIEADREKIDTKYNLNRSKIDSKILELQDAMIIEQEEQKVNFIFDGTQLEEEFKSIIRGYEDKKDSLIEEKKSKKERLKALRGEYEKKSYELENSLAELGNEYFRTEVSNNIELPEDYLININGINPNFFKLPNSSVVFTYSSEECLSQFLDILLYQTISRINPNCIHFDIIDTRTLGGQFLEIEDEVVSIYTTEESIRDKMEVIAFNVKKRMSLMVGKEDIVEYNNFMRDMDCPTEGYNFIVHLYPNLGGFNGNEYQQVMINGTRVGYQYLVFINEKDINQSNKSSIINLFDTVKYIYKLEDSSVNKRAKQYYLDKLENNNL